MNKPFTIDYLIGNCEINTVESSSILNCTEGIRTDTAEQRTPPFHACGITDLCLNKFDRTLLRGDDISKYHFGLRTVQVKLEGTVLWDKFHSFNTEMIVTKNGRRMFPTLRISLNNLDENMEYSIMVDMSCVDNKRYRYSFHQSKWIVASSGEAELPCRVHVHSDSPSLGSHWMKQAISFDKIKLTNNQLDQNGHIIVNSMHRYQPNIHIVVHSEEDGVKCRTFTFSNTEFMAVTAYQNHRVCFHQR